MTTHTRVFAHFGVAVLAAAGLTLAASTTAAAHVTVRPDVDTSGSWAKLSFRVPNESEEAATVGLRVELPTDTPFRSVRAQPRPGWTVELTREALPEPVEIDGFTLDEAVTAITWTANDDVQIGPDEFDEFAISVGPLPEPGTYPLPAEQIYDDGEVVPWTEGPDDDHPAPVLTVVEEAGKPGAEEGRHQDGSDEDDANAADSTDGGSDGLARGLGAGGLALGAIGIGVGGSLYRKSRA